VSRPDEGRLSGSLLLAGAALSFSLTGLSAKMLSPSIDPPQLVLLRSAFMVVVVGAWALRRGEPLWIARRREGLLLLLRGVLGTAGFLLFFGALQRIPLADTVILFQAHPLVVAALGPWLLRERTRPAQWALMALSLLGVGLVVGPTGAGDLAGRGMALGCALVAGCAYSIMRLLSASVPTLTIAFVFPAVAVATAGPLIALDVPGFSWSDPTAADWMWILSVAVTSTAGQILLTLGLGRVQAARGSAISNSQAVFAILWGVLFLGEYPSWNTLLGAAIVITCLVLLSRRSAHLHTHGQSP
jgi:drug/metabolite transporter (DMT)-like permease